MPSYQARGITLRLGAQPLADTITPEIVLKKGPVAKTQCEKAERKLLSSKLLREEHVHFPDDKVGFELNWLGDAPFMQVRAGDELFEEGRYKCTAPTATTADFACNLSVHGEHPSIARSSNDSLALSLHVQLSEKSFLSGLDTSEKLHLKIDVFFNGKLSNCVFIPFHDIRSGAKAYHQVFAGHRIDFLAERPWVILPPQTDATVLDAPQHAIPTEKRWQDICDALICEADERGTDKNGNLPPTAKYLKSLATMQMPQDIRSTQKSGKKSIGVIDVIITAGDGRKVTTGTAYLKAPQRLADENYPVRVSLGDEEKETSKLGHNEPLETMARNTRPMMKKTPDLNAERNNDSDYRPRAKRSAAAPLAPPVLSKKGTVSATLSPEKVSQTRILPVSILQMPNPTTSMPTFPKPGERRSEILSSPEQDRAYRQDFTGHCTQTISSDASYGTSQSAFSFPGTSASYAQTPQMHASSFSFQFSDSVLGQDSPSCLMGLTSLGTAGYQCSPLQQFPKGMKFTSSQTPYPPTTRISGVHEAQDSTSSASSMSLPIPLGRDLIHPDLASGSVVTTTWDGHATKHVMRPPISFQAPEYVPNMLPISKSFSPYGRTLFGGVSCPSLYDGRVSMPLPPTGLFSVSRKPRSSKSPFKKSRCLGPGKHHGSFCMRRLVITGRDGATLVDHRWPTLQRVASESGNLQSHQAPDDLPSSSLVSSSTSTESHVIPIAERRSKNSNQANTSPALVPHYHDEPTSVLLSSDPSQVSIQSDGHESPDNSDLSSPVSLEEEDKGSQKNNIIRANQFEASTQSTKRVSRAVIVSAIPQRRVSSNTNILGVQGPKATTFWLEDPEEMLREAARMRRSRSPIKSKKQATPATKLTKPAPLMSVLNVRAAALSSPLSTAPSSPVSKGELNPKQAKDESIIPSNARSGATAIPQFDGSPERKLVSSSPHNICTLSLTKNLASTSKPHLPPKTTSRLKPSPTPNTKKRKAAALAPGRYLPKAPRSPDRLRTVGNPSLNQNCIIAFAESEDKESEMGVLRQVKGERQGVFAEEYVVFAARFFVAGN